eukprot:602312-Prymnesium_polylepis.1
MADGRNLVGAWTGFNAPRERVRPDLEGASTPASTWRNVSVIEAICGMIYDRSKECRERASLPSFAE